MIVQHIHERDHDRGQEQRREPWRDAVVEFPDAVELVIEFLDLLGGAGEQILTDPRVGCPHPGTVFIRQHQRQQHDEHREYRDHAGDEQSCFHPRDQEQKEYGMCHRVTSCNCPVAGSVRSSGSCSMVRTDDAGSRRARQRMYMNSAMEENRETMPMGTAAPNDVRYSAIMRGRPYRCAGTLMSIPSRCRYAIMAMISFCGSAGAPDFMSSAAICSAWSRSSSGARCSYPAG